MSVSLKPEEKRKIIVEHWFRKLFTISIITDITHVIIEYLKIIEKFGEALCDSILRFNEDRTIITRVEGEGDENGWKHAFGIVIAEPGTMYEWKLKVFQHKEYTMIGIMEADKCGNNIANDYFFHEPYACSYLSDQGNYFSGKSDVTSPQDATEYGMDNDDIVGVYLDLKENTLQFSKNDEKYRKIKYPKKDTQYRLIVSFFAIGTTQKVEIIHFRQTIS